MAKLIYDQDLISKLIEYDANIQGRRSNVIAAQHGVEGSVWIVRLRSLLRTLVPVK